MPLLLPFARGRGRRGVPRPRAASPPTTGSWPRTSGSGDPRSGRGSAPQVLRSDSPSSPRNGPAWSLLIGKYRWLEFWPRIVAGVSVNKPALALSRSPRELPSPCPAAAGREGVWLRFSAEKVRVSSSVPLRFSGAGRYLVWLLVLVLLHFINICVRILQQSDKYLWF